MVAIYAALTEQNNYNAQHIAVYELLYRVLDSFYGYPKCQLTLCRTTEGKPYCKNLPLQFSLCHTDGLILVAVSDLPCGIDAEKSDRVISDAVARRFLKLDSATIKDWTRYESVGKMIGCGVPYDPEELDLSSCYSRIYSEPIGYTVCCASSANDFPNQIIIL